VTLKRVLILGIDGYLGWALALHLSKAGYAVNGCDNLLRRKLVSGVGSVSATPIRSWPERYAILSSMNSGRDCVYKNLDVVSYSALKMLLEVVEPDTIVHFAQMPSAPYSMKGIAEAAFTYKNNLIGNLNLIFAMRDVCPEAHLVKLGTMGEYGTPGVDISEGDFEVEYKGRKAMLPFPRQPASFYHCTKVHDSTNIRMACKFWGLRVTDIMQGVVFGVTTPDIGTEEELVTRFDFDESFGTAINRFCAQAVAGLPITPYGKGGQNRGFLALRDSIQCIRLIIDNPAVGGEHRVINQFEDVYNLFNLALIVQKKSKEIGFNSRVVPVDNPRIEEEDHYYNPEHKKLSGLGYLPLTDVESEVSETLKVLKSYKERIVRCKEAIKVKTLWGKSG
jgi:nucleoside-diphosphate-sugar epimerase